MLVNYFPLSPFIVDEENITRSSECHRFLENIFISHPKANLFSSSFLLLLVLVQVMLLGKLHVPQVLGIHALQLDALFGGGFPRRISVILTSLIVIGVILGLCHD